MIANATENSITLREPQEDDRKVATLDAAAQDPLSIPLMGATADYTAILGELHDESFNQLRELMQPFFKELGDHLFDLSAAGRSSGSSQNVYYDAMVHLRRHGSELIA